MANGSIKLPLGLGQAFQEILEVYKGSRILCFHRSNGLKDNRFEHNKMIEQILQCIALSFKSLM